MESGSSPSPAELTHDQVKRLIEVGPKTEMVLIGDDIYRRHGAVWVLLQE